MKTGHKKVEGMVSEVKPGLCTVKTSTGATLTLAESAALRYGHDLPKLDDELTPWVNEGNMVMAVLPK